MSEIALSLFYSDCSYMNTIKPKNCDELKNLKYSSRHQPTFQFNKPLQLAIFLPTHLDSRIYEKILLLYFQRFLISTNKFIDY